MSEDGERVVELVHGAARIDHSAHTDAGRVRSMNEDAYLASAPVYLVADGMGGHARGDAASAAVVETFRRHLVPDRASSPEQVLDAIHSSNEAVRALTAEGEEGTAVAGTTLTGVALVDAGDAEGLHWMVFNVGDSRVYSWDGRALTQLTVDHSAVQELVDAGLISPTDAERHPERNVITRAIGADEVVEPDVWLLPARAQQTFLVCSDGLTKEVDDDDIARILARPSGSNTAEELVQTAVARGGRDNATVVVVHAEIPGDEAAESTRDRPLGDDVERTTPRGKGGGDAELPA